MRAFINYRNELANYLNITDPARIEGEMPRAQLTKSISATEINSLSEIKLKEYTDAKSLFIDELGREEGEVKSFGTVKTPMASLLFTRNENIRVTFATTNKTKDELHAIYKDALFDRMFEMFNFIVCPDSLQTFRRNDDYQLQSQLKNKQIN